MIYISGRIDFRDGQEMTEREKESERKKGKGSTPDGVRLENFKSATVAALKALAGRRDIDITYATDSPLQERLTGKMPKKLKLRKKLFS